MAVGVLLCCVLVIILGCCYCSRLIKKIEADMDRPRDAKLKIMHKPAPSNSILLKKADAASVSINVDGNSGIVDTREMSPNPEGDDDPGPGHEGVVDEMMIDEDNEEKIEIMEWLREVGFEGYYDNFELNGYQSLEFVKEIKGRIELKEIGIDNDGHQMRMLEEIRKLKDRLKLDGNLSGMSEMSDGMYDNPEENKDLRVTQGSDATTAGAISRIPSGVV